MIGLIKTTIFRPRENKNSNKGLPYDRHYSQLCNLFYTVRINNLDLSTPTKEKICGLRGVFLSPKDALSNPFLEVAVPVQVALLPQCEKIESVWQLLKCICIQASASLAFLACYRRTYPVIACKCLRAIHKFDSANSIFNCAVFLASPR